MVRLCERPGCSAPADVMYGIDADTLTVWIQALDPDAPSRPGVLCRRHADAMVVPLRWTLDDRREPVPRLFRSPATADVPARERAPRATSPVVGTQLELDDTGELPREAVEARIAPVEADAEAPAAAADARETVPWKPVFDPDDDLDGLLQARSPLLSRAFHGRARRPAE
ncbi:MAG: hypothetical protein ABIR68_04015 [Ilumatobacteraceae bacterium]